MKKPTKFLFLGLLFYTLPILVFGNFNSLLEYIFLPISLIVLYWRMIKRVKNEDTVSYINGALLGFFLIIFGLKPLTIEYTKPLLQISFTYGNILGYWISFLSYYSFYGIYRNKMETYRMSEFEFDMDKLERDKKIDSIINRGMF